MASPTTIPTPSTAPGALVRTGAEILAADEWALIAGDRVAVVAHAASLVDGRHVVDVLAEHDAVDLVAVFTPEHGLRGLADAGEVVVDSVDPTTGVPVYSLYGDRRAPDPDQLKGVDVVVYDLQDVGVRCYTYISTMGLVMQAAAAAGVPVVVLDRPNPQGRARLDGPMRDDEQVSFVSAYPLPLLYGLTSGELAVMIRDEEWLEGLENLDLTVVGTGSSRDTWPNRQGLWVPPSPGLPTAAAALAYPGTVLFEATSLGFGQGTEAPFQIIGRPGLDAAAAAVVLERRDLEGVEFESAMVVPSRRFLAHPDLSLRYEGEMVAAVRLTITDPRRFRPVATAVHLLEVLWEPGLIDRPAVFDLLAGTSDLRRKLEAGTPAGEIIAGWDTDLDAFDELRRAYAAD